MQIPGFDDLPRRSVPVADSPARFPVGRIFCIGRNYADHAAEMNAPADAIIFMKPPTSLAREEQAIVFPRDTMELHHEVELVVAIGAAGRPTEEGEAERLIWGYGVGLDLTRRDVQAAAKKRGEPWEEAKAFDDSAVVGPLMSAADWPHRRQGAISLRINDALRQSGDIADMLLSPPAIAIQIARHWELQPGDLIFTGTPAGVGPLEPGDVMIAEVEGLAPLKASIAER